MSSRPSRGAARLAAILDALPDALVLVNANGTVVNANTIALEAFEAPGTALVGRGLLDLLPQFDSKLIPGSMRRPDHIDPRARTKPTRMTARRTDGTEFPVEVTSANLENGQQAYDGHGYTGDELLMLVVRDLSGTVDTEAELARSQRQTEMILRAASEGVVGTDTDGRIVLVNPAAAQILGYRAGELGGRELHTLVLHSRADGSPFPYEESPLADTLRSGRKHRVRGQVLWSKSGDKVPVDLTTAPVRDGDQLVGAVMTFTDRRPYDALAEEKTDAEKQHAEELERLAGEHASELADLRRQHATEIEELTERHAEELAANEDRYAALGEREKDRYEALAARHEQLLTLLGRSLRGPLDELRRELAALAADDAGQLWPEANQVLHHLSAGYSRITTLIDNVLGYQRLDAGSEEITRTKVMLDAVVAAGVEGAVELVGPGRVQFAVHAPPIEAEVDPQRLATALAHLVADVAGVDATGNAPVSAGGYMDNTVVVAAAQRGEVVRIEVRGPYTGGDPVHEPIVRGIVRAHGGVLQTHEVPGMSGNAYVLEVPLGGGAGAVAAAPGPVQAQDADQDQGQEEGHGQGFGADPAAVAGPGAGQGASAEADVPEPASARGRRRARRASTDAFLEGDGEGDAPDGQSAPTGRRRRRAAGPAQEAEPVPAQGADGSGGTGRRRGRPADDAGVAEGAVVTAAEHAAGTAAAGTGLGGTVPPQGVPAPTGRRARRDGGEPHALPAALPAAPEAADGSGAQAAQPTGRRRRALAAATERAAAQEAAPRAVFALPPAEADRPSGPGPEQAQPGQPGQGGQPVQVQVPAQAAPVDAVADAGRHDAVPQDQSDDHTPPQPHPASAPTGRRRRAVAQPSGAPGVAAVPAQAGPAAGTGAQGVAGSAAQPAVPGQGGAVSQQGGPVAPGPQMPQAQPMPQGQVPPGQPAGQAPQGQQGQMAAAVPAQGTAGQPVPATQAVPPTGVPVPGQAVPAPGQAASGQPVPVPAQIAPGQPVPVPAQATPGQPVPVPAQATPGQPVPVPAQATPGQPVPVPAQATPGQPVPVPAQATPGQPVPVPAQATPGQPVPVPAQATPGQPVPVQMAPGQPVVAPQVPGQSVPAQQLPGQQPVSVPVPVPPVQGLPAQGAGPAPAPNAPAPGQALAAQPLPGQALAAQPLPGQGAAQPAQVPTAPAQAVPGQAVQGGPVPAQGAPAQGVPVPGVPAAQPAPGAGTPLPQQWPGTGDTAGAPGAPGAGAPVPPNGTPAPVPPNGAAGPVPPNAPGAPVPPPVPGTPLPPGVPVPPAQAVPVPNAAGPVPGTPAQGTPTPAPGTPLPPEQAAAPGQPVAPPAGQPAGATRAAQPLPAEAAASGDPTSTQGRAISVRTLGQGVPFSRQAAQAQAPQPGSATPPPHATGGSGRRRKLGTRPDPAAAQAEQRPGAARPQPPAEQPPAQPSLAGQSRLAPATEGAGRSYAIGAPDVNAAEGPEPLDGPGGAVEIADTPRPQPMDDELPPEPLDNPRRLLVWPAPDVNTQQALSDRGYRPVIVHSREEVDAQIAAFPAALFVDPLTGPITRTALQSLRRAAVAAEVPVLVTAGLGQATREAAYGADPAVLLKALAPRDSEQHPPRVLLIEEHAEIALALTATLERRGMQVARAASDADAVTLAGQFRPNLVVMDLMQVHRRRAGIVDWLRANGQLNRTPLVVYTAAVDPADLPRLASGETVLFLAERSTSGEVQDRIVDLLARIGTN
ncbi:PAS domain-containing protein [Streptomyces sp. NPDC046831]|uniref:PAS domain-containing protein n=1 Tax=Streptomyces sp. NPDC046831 TaxID=3154805 RepID=UPI0033EA150E